MKQKAREGGDGGGELGGGSVFHYLRHLPDPYVWGGGGG